MEKFSDFRLFDEAKDSIINRLKSLTDEQKKQVVDFFRTHNDFENRIDWNRANSKSNPLTWKDFEDLMTEVEGRKLPKEGLKDLTEGEDYIKLSSNIDGIDAYAILTHRGSVAIASNNTEPKVWTMLPSWYQRDNVDSDYPLDRNTGLYGGAKWCTAMHHTDNYFKDYTKDRGILVYYIVNNIEKYAILFKNRGDSLRIEGTWNSEDNIVDNSVAEVIGDTNKDRLIELISDRCGSAESTAERDSAVDEWGDSLVYAFEEFWGDPNDIPYENISDYFVGNFESAEDIYMGTDYTFDAETVTNWCDLEAVGEEVWEEEVESVEEEELKEIYPQYWDENENDWDVDYEELARNYIDEIFPSRGYMYIGEFNDQYHFIYDKIDFDNMADTDGYRIIDGYCFCTGW